MNDTNLNHKLRSDSVFAELTSEQIEQLEDWLFEEKLGYKAVREKLQQEFGVKTSQTALGRFCRRLAESRAQDDRLQTMMSCLEALATAKGDGTLQAGLFTMANMHAVRLMTEEKPSFREITAWLRAMTSAGAFEMKRAEIYEAKEKERLAEIERKEKEAREKEMHARWSAEDNARYEAREAKRKATIAAKKAKAVANAKAEAEAVAARATEAAKEATSPRPSPPEAERVPDGVGHPVESLQRVAEAEPQAQITGQSDRSTPNGAPAILEPLHAAKPNEKPPEILDELTQIEQFGYVAINWAGNPR